MGATGFSVVGTKNTLLSTFASSFPYVTLLKALTLQASTSVGATSFSVDLSVAAGDTLIFDFSLGTQETVIVSSVSGAGPYTVTPVNALTKAHSVTGPTPTYISHMPAASATVHEVAITRAAASWGSPANGVLTSGSPAISSIPVGTVVGSLAVFSASTAGTYGDSTPVPATTYGSGSNTANPTWVETLT